MDFSLHNTEVSEALELRKDFRPVENDGGCKDKLDVREFVFLEERHQVIHLCLEVVVIWEFEVENVPTVLPDAPVVEPTPGVVVAVWLELFCDSE